MLVNYYRSRPDQTADDLIALCADCARRYGSRVTMERAGRAADACEFCGAANDLNLKRQRDEDYERFHGR